MSPNTAALLSPAALLDGFGDAVVSAGLAATIHDEDFGEAFKQNLKGFAIGQATSALQFGVGELKGNNGIADGSFGAGLLHGLVGCAAAEASGGACASGFAVAFGTELVAGSLGKGFVADPSQSAEDNEKARKAYEQNRAAMVGALAGYVTSGGNAVNVSQGSSIARGAVTWNRQLHLNEMEILGRMLGRENIRDDIFDEDPSALSDFEREVLAVACAKVHCSDQLEAGPQYEARKALQAQGVQLIATGGTAFDALQSAMNSYFEENGGFWMNRATVTSLHELSGGSSGTAMGGFLYTGYDARLDLAHAIGVDLYGQSRANGVLGLPEAALDGALASFNLLVTGLDCMNNMEACRSLVNSGVQTAEEVVALARNIPEYAKLIKSTDLAVARFIDGKITRDEFIIVLADSGQIAGSAEAIIVGMGLSAATGGAARIWDGTEKVPEGGFVFRGTTEGFEGSAGTQAANVTPTSSDPLVAATFCKNAECTYGIAGEFQVIRPDIATEITIGGYKPAEFEVILEGVTPNQVTNSPLTQSYTLPQAEDAFSQMGITVPNSHRLNGLEDTLNFLQSQGITPLSPAQIQQFQNNLNGVQ